MNTRHIKTIALALALAMAFSGTAMAKSPKTGVRIGIESHFGLGGETEFELGSTQRDQDEEATIGVGVRVEYELHKYFHVGFLTSLHFWRTEPQDNVNADRNLFIDLAPVLKVRRGFHNERGEVFLEIPVGLTIAKFSDEAEKWVAQNVDNQTPQTGLGWNVALMAGASYRVFDSLSIQARLGWKGRGGSYEMKRKFNDGQQYWQQQSSTQDLEYELHQFAMNFGMFYTF